MIFHRYLSLEHISEENLPVVLGIMRMLHYRQTHFQKTAGKKKNRKKSRQFYMPFRMLSVVGNQPAQ